LGGMVAAWITNSSKVGIVGGMKIACCLKGYRGFQFGVEAMSEKLGKDVQYMEVMVNDYNDIGKAYESALSLIDSGVDVVVGWQNIACKGVNAAAKERGILQIGMALDQNQILDSERIVTSMKWVFPMKAVFEDLAAGTFYPAKLYLPGMEADYDRNGDGIFGGYDGRFEGYYTGLYDFHDFKTRIANYPELEAILTETARQIATGELIVPRIYFE